MCDSFSCEADKPFVFNSGIFRFVAYRKNRACKLLKTGCEKRVTH